MLVAFAIGERFELRELGSSGRKLIGVSAGETLLTFILVAAGVGTTAYSVGIGGEGAGWGQSAAIGLLCAAIAVERTSWPFRWLFTHLECELATEFLQLDLQRVLAEERFGDTVSHELMHGYVRLLGSRKQDGR